MGGKGRESGERRAGQGGEKRRIEPRLLGGMEATGFGLWMPTRMPTPSA